MITQWLFIQKNFNNQMITNRFSVSHLGPFKTSTMKLFAKIRIQSEISACLRILRYTYTQSFLVGNYTFKVTIEVLRQGVEYIQS